MEFWVHSQRSVLSPVAPIDVAETLLRGLIGGTGGWGRGAGRGSVPPTLTGWATTSSSPVNVSDLEDDVLLLLLLSTFPFPEGCDNLSGLGGRSGLITSPRRINKN